MTSWKTTIGGALSALGTTLMGVGLVPQVANGPSPLLMWVSISGFIVSALGTFFSHLFAADKSDMIKRIKESESDTKQLLRKKEDK